MAKGNDGNYLQHSIETEAAIRLVREGAGGRLHIALGHGMEPFEPFDHKLAEKKPGLCRSNLEDALDRSRRPMQPGEPSIVTAYRKTEASEEHYPNSAELSRALVGTDKLAGGIAEIDSEKSKMLAEAWAGSDVVTVCSSWRRQVLSGGVLACPGDLRIPWLFTLDPMTYRETERVDDEYLYYSDIDLLSEALTPFTRSKQPGIAAFFVYNVKPGDRRRFRKFVDELAGRVGATIRSCCLTHRGGKCNLAAVLCSHIELSPDFLPAGLTMHRPTVDDRRPGVSVMANDGGYVDALVRTLWLWADKHHRDELDGGPRLKRPPVLATGAASRNVLVPSQRSKADSIRAALPKERRHRGFRSLKSSQALTQSVFGAIQAFDRLDLLQDLPAECGRPAFCENADGWTFELEHSLRGLGEPRPTSVDVLASGPGTRVAVECKLTEGEFGTCSRPRLCPCDEQYCNGSYTVQQRRRSRCALTEIGIRYWDHLPRLFDWPDDRDHEPCPFGETYQLARNALAATLTPDGRIDPGQGHVLVVYDARNPGFRGEARAAQQWKAVVASCRVPGLVRRVSWQRLMAALADARELAYLVDAVAEKYGLEPGP